MGYVKTGSLPSVAAGWTVGILCRSTIISLRCTPISICDWSQANAIPKQDGLGGYRLLSRQTYGIEFALLASVVLGGASIPRALKSGKPVPTVLSLISVFGLLVFGNAYRKTL